MPVEIPEPIRAAAGLAVTVLGHARQLPANISGLPVRVAGLAMQTSLRLQQSYAGLVVKGDELLTQIQRSDDDAPSWATFDDEVVDIAAGMTEGLGADVTAAGRRAGAAPPSASVPSLTTLPGATRKRPSEKASRASRLGHTPSAFDLAEDSPTNASSESITASHVSVPRAAGQPSRANATNGQAATSEPPVPGYDAMTLAQLRARLRTFDAATLTRLHNYEREKRARAPYLTMLENRLNRSRDHSRDRSRDQG